MGLAEQNAAQAKKVMDGVGSRIDALATVAEQLRLVEAARLLREQRDLLAKDAFWLIVLGRFRNGKSTFLNSLLCEMTRPVSQLGAARGPLPVKDLPTTATLTTIEYGDEPSVRVVQKSGSAVDWSLERFMVEGSIRRDPDENQRFFGDISEFQMRFPSKTLRSGITLLDSPGTDDIRERTEIVERAVHKCDAAIVLLRSDVLGGMDEQAFIRSLVAVGLTDLFFVVNRRDGRPVDEELRSEAWFKIVHLALGGPKYAGQDLSQRRISFVDARAALEARLGGDAKALADSGLEAFEAKLASFLERERRPAHIRRFVQAADAHARGIEESIARLIPTIRAKADEFQAKYAEIEPELRDIRNTTSRVPKIIAHYRSRSEAALETSFRQLINDICRDLPTALARERIPSIDNAGILDRAALTFRQKKIEQEVTFAARQIYERHLASWRDNPPERAGAQQVVGGLIDEMIGEIYEELRRIKRRFDRIQFELTGFLPDLSTSEAAAEGWTRRILLVASGLISPDYPINFIAGGWPAVFRGLFLHGTAAAIVMVLGGPAGWALLAGMAVNLAVQGVLAPEAIKTRLRTNVCQKLIPMLRGQPDRVRPMIAEGVRKSFDQIERGISEAIDQEIAKEEQTLREQLELTHKSVEEKQKVLEGLERCRDEVGRCRKGLRDALIAVEVGAS